MRSVRLVVVIGLLLVTAVAARGFVTNSYQLYGTLSGDWSGNGTRANMARGRSRADLLAQSATGTRQLSFDRTSLVLVFDPNCSVCGENMPRWLDVLDRIRRDSLDVRVYALSLDSTHAEAVRYWQSLEHRVEVLTPVNRADAVRDFKVLLTPTSLVLRDGHVAAEYLGLLGQRRIDHLMRQLR